MPVVTFVDHAEDAPSHQGKNYPQHRSETDVVSIFPLTPLRPVCRHVLP
jgi:hypothetical protein